MPTVFNELSNGRYINISEDHCRTLTSTNDGIVTEIREEKPKSQAILPKFYTTFSKPLIVLLIQNIIGYFPNL